jgi:regulator of protease activity HflC (stomatin/prohibitin superfamily)
VSRNLLRGLGRAAFAALCLSTAGALLVHACHDRVPSGAIGVRIERDGTIAEREYAAGAHWSLPWPHRFRLLPAGSITTEFRLENPAESLEIRTSDDQTARVAAVALWRLAEGRAWRVVASGLEQRLTTQVRDTVEDVLRTGLAVLGSDEWFAVARRNQALEALRADLAAALAPLEVELVDVALLDVEFSLEYTKKLQQKQSAVQMVRREEANQAVERTKRELDQLRQQVQTELNRRLGASDLALQTRRAEVERQLTAAHAEAERRAAELRAAADREYREAVAEGERALTEASAQAEGLRLAALARPGGEAWLARRAAAALDIGRVQLVAGEPGVPTVFDLAQLQGLLGGR